MNDCVWIVGIFWWKSLAFGEWSLVSVLQLSSEFHRKTAAIVHLATQDNTWIIVFEFANAVVRGYTVCSVAR